MRRAFIVTAAVLTIVGCTTNVNDVKDPGYPLLDDMKIDLAAPISTYSAVAHDPAGGEVHLSWHMDGETCGLPRVPWDQGGASVTWSHSIYTPDLCSHIGTDHAVTATLTITTVSGLNRGAQLVCTIKGSENRHVAAAEIAFNGLHKCAF